MNIIFNKIIYQFIKILKKNLILLFENLILSFLFVSKYNLNNYSKKKVIIFMFHEITDTPSDYQKEYSLFVNVKKFKKQIEFIQKNFNILNPKDLENKTIKDHSALITFDDGFYGSMEYALPILEKNNIYSIHFLNSEVLNKNMNISGLQKYLFNNSRLIAKYNFSLKEVRKLNIYPNKKVIRNFDYQDNKDIRNYIGRFINKDELFIYTKKYKYFYIANHLSNHYNVINLSNNQITESFNENKKILSKYSNYLNYFSYPFGQENLNYNDKINSFIKKNLTKIIFSANPKNYYFSKDILSRLPMFNNTKINKIFVHIILRNLIEKLKNFR